MPVIVLYVILAAFCVYIVYGSVQCGWVGVVSSIVFLSLVIYAATTVSYG